ncbi:MAG: hypothetical protein KF785_14540 [Gemmatimonadales bacterium]|nr:hypothetical protein [Gemmatimonadales bacterium]
MAARTLLGLGSALALALTACGGDEDGEAKRAALTPATVAVVDSATVSAAAAPADSAAGSLDSAETTLDSAVTNEEETLGRESFSYGGGSRDPFQSLLASSRVGPELPDLVLVAIYYDTRSTSGSVVVMREKVGNRKYNLRPGDRLGRMRVTSVRPKDVTFTIDDFGTERQETVSLRKQEEN